MPTCVKDGVTYATITYTQLDHLGACGDYLDQFEAMFGETLVITDVDDVIQTNAGESWETQWMVDNLLLEDTLVTRYCPPRLPLTDELLPRSGTCDSCEHMGSTDTVLRHILETYRAQELNEIPASSVPRRLRDAEDVSDNTRFVWVTHVTFVRLYDPTSVGYNDDVWVDVGDLDRSDSILQNTPYQRLNHLDCSNVSVFDVTDRLRPSDAFNHKLAVQRSLRASRV